MSWAAVGVMQPRATLYSRVTFRRQSELPRGKKTTTTLRVALDVADGKEGEESKDKRERLASRIGLIEHPLLGEPPSRTPAATCSRFEAYTHSSVVAKKVSEEGCGCWLWKRVGEFQLFGRQRERKKKSTIHGRSRRKSAERFARRVDRCRLLLGGGESGCGGRQGDGERRVSEPSWTPEKSFPNAAGATNAVRHGPPSGRRRAGAALR